MLLARGRFFSPMIIQIQLQPKLGVSAGLVQVTRLMMSRLSLLLALTASGWIVGLSGCSDSPIRVYTAPKDVLVAAEADGEDHSGHAHGSTGAAPSGQEAAPRFAWILPEGWKETEPGQLSVVAFTVPTPAGDATVNITPLPNVSGQEEEVLNIWRGQVGLGPVNKEEVASQLQPITVAGSPGKLVEFSGQREGKSVRIVSAMVHASERSWFYKLAGDDPAVLAAKSAFLTWLASVRFETGPEPAQPSNAPASSPAAPSPATANVNAGAPPEAAMTWPAPPQWTAMPPGAMQAAKFSVPPTDGATAEVTVSIFPSDTGGMLANVNRWRGQLGMEPTDESGLAACTTPIEGVNGAVLADLANADRRMLGAIVPRDGRWFFYKLLGGAPAVAAQRDAFVQFAKTPQ